MSKQVYFLVLAFCMTLTGCGDKAHSDYDKNSPITSETQKSSDANDSQIEFYSFNVRDIDGWLVPLSKYKGKIILIVNVASDCRFTNQYKNLQRLYTKYRDRGFVVLAFPSNDFGNQEPGTNAEIKEFAANRFNVKFLMCSKITVKGEFTNPLYRYLTSAETNSQFSGPITWNFNKFLIDKNGRTIARFPSETDPMAPEIIQAIEAALE